MRLNAYLARAGIASRRGADELIKAGRVTVDGAAASMPMTFYRSSTLTVGFSRGPVPGAIYYWSTTVQGVRRAAVQIAHRGARAFQEIGEARGRSADHAPEQAEKQQAEHDRPDQQVDIHAVIFRAPPHHGDEHDQQPVEQPGRQVPHAHPRDGFARPAQCCSGAR